MARHWHFFFAWLFVINGLAYVLCTSSAATCGATSCRRASELRGIGRSIRDHVQFRHPTGEEAKRYNVLQNLAYLA